MKNVNVLLISFLAFCSNAAEVKYTLTQMEKNKGLYLTCINKISLDSNNELIFEGKREKKVNITSNTIKSVMNNIKSSVTDPECTFVHSKEEVEAYFTFDEDFRTRPFESNGMLQVMAWQRNKFKQNVCLSNVKNETEFASVLFDADYCLKKIVLGKKLVGVRKMNSFTGYLQLMIMDKMESKSFVRGIGYESIFRLLPDTVFLNIDQGKSYEVTRAKFKLVPLNLSDSLGYNKIEWEWAKTFNTNYDKIIDKHDELKKVNELFKLYVLLKTCINKDLLPQSDENSVRKVAETIKSIKFSQLIEYSDPLINMPTRLFFQWLLISGGVSFDLTNAVIVKKSISRIQ
jgi:hypothetical protein